MEYKRAPKYQGQPIGPHEELNYAKPLRPGESYITMLGWILFCGMLVIPFLNLLCWIPLIVCRKKVPLDLYDDRSEGSRRY